MTRLSLGLLALALSTSTVFAQDYLNCGLKISDNKIDCPFFGGCNHKVLKESNAQIVVEVNEGELKEGKISLQNVILFPGTKKENKNKVTLFKKDNRAEKLKTDKKIDLVTYDSKNSIGYSVQKFGNTLNISFKNNDYTLNMDLTGNAKFHDYFLTSGNAVLIICERLNKEIYEELKSKKTALDNHAKEKLKASKASKQ